MTERTAEESKARYTLNYLPEGFAGVTQEDTARVAARLKEIDATIAELEREKRQLLAEKSSLTRPAASVSPPGQEQQPAELSEKALSKALNMLEWNEFKKKEGEWAFLRTRQGDLVEDLKPIAGFIDQLRKGKRLTVGRYEYVASEDKFLNRYLRAPDSGR